MFRAYGIIGLLMLAFAQLNFIFQIHPYAQWYFPIIWFGYILFVDALVYRMYGKSLIYNRPKMFIVLLILSAVIWWMFEGIGFILQNWYYTGLEGFGTRFEKFLFGTLSFSTVIPAVFETYHLLRSVHLFDHTHLKKKHKISKTLLHTLTVLGILFLILPLAAPMYFYPIIWIAFFFLLDPKTFF
ncbi:MAG: hypothetical protein ABIA56_01155 [Actinomycetota bacterium]